MERIWVDIEVRMGLEGLFMTMRCCNCLLLP